ncbi:hypothetical protein H2198_002813 [Neophaeococcomyces mojaviensis]|uniref:Uncharacterized protein n=1 Tax=Neophaeococcomyces mojaviensis TaxID=3383035 RepID=A0ACC3ADK4_9EURO|nr:hypothetical protein H2198_002813 [Knufia sp. JES_112]
MPIRRFLDPTTDDDTTLFPVELNGSAQVIWQQLVSQYCKRRLTLAKDKLPAVAGLAQHYAKYYVNLDADQYLAGLWLSQLPHTLLWHIGHISGVFASQHELYRAPTWSWAYVDYDDIDWLGFDRDAETFATIERAEISLPGENTYGQVREAKLRIKAPLKRGLLLPDTHYGDYNEVWAEDAIQEFRERIPGTRGARLGRISFDLAEPRNSENELLYVHCLRITPLAGLVIEPCGGDSSCQIWRRVGVVDFFDSSICWWQNCVSSVITLI